jgi:hypothetical protein
MAHYAFLDENNIVTEVIVGIDETDLIEGLNTETWYGNFRGQSCKRTSYNGNIRKNYAGIGYIYDELRDAFYSPQPFPSWTLDEETCTWQAPKLKMHEWCVWNEEIQDWDCSICK